MMVCCRPEKAIEDAKFYCELYFFFKAVRKNTKGIFILNLH
jgi:hypothetical protein